MCTRRRAIATWLLFVSSVVGCQETSTESAASNSAVTNDSAPADSDTTDVTLTAADEHGFDEVIAAQRGKVVLVDFWATWCLPCLEGFPHTVELYNEYHDRGLEVVSVSFDEETDHDAALAFLKKSGAVFTNLRSPYGFHSDVPFQTEGALPVIRVYDGQGKIVAAFASGDPTQPPYTPDDVRQAVEQALESLH